MSRKMLSIIIAVVAAAGLCVALIINLVSPQGETSGQAGLVPIPVAVQASEPSDAGSTGKDSNPSRGGPELTILKDAAEANRYVFIFFYKEDDQQTRAMRNLFDQTMSKVSDRAETVTVRTGDPEARRIVEKYRVNRAPMPLVLAIAPNGAVTQGYSREFTEEQLLEAFVGPSTEKCIKALQEQKLALLCVQNSETSLNEEAMRGVRNLKNDSVYKDAAEVVMVDPNDPAERGLLENLKVNSELEQATTIVLAPPGGIVATFEGATDKKTIVAAIKKATSGSGCGPNASPGCCPPKKK